MSKENLENCTSLSKYQKDLSILYKAITLLNTKEEVAMFFDDLCTPAEIRAMSDRWLVVDELKKGYSYRKIYENTGVSVTTVGRISRYISLGKGGYNLIYNRLKKKKNDSKK